LVAAVAPFAIIIGAAATVVLLFWSTWDRVLRSLGPLGDRYRADLDRALIRLSREELVLLMVGISAAIWIAAVVFLHPPLLLAAILLPATLAIVFYATGFYIRQRIKRRLNAFNDQLEIVLRLLSSGLRAGLSLRQAFVLVIEELADPARMEFRRVVAQTNVGVGVNEAMERLAERMPGDELSMLVRTIRVQSQTGGNLGKILDHLASTIRERRKIKRKMKALTAEGRASGWIISLLPVLMGLYVFFTQPRMRDAMLHTSIGLTSIVASVVLEIIGIFAVMQIVSIDI
jgi:tight adherence protein B